MCIDDFNGDNFDHGPLSFVGGGYIGCGADQRPADPTTRPPGNAAPGGRVEAGRGEELFEQVTKWSPTAAAAATATPIATSIQLIPTGSAASSCGSRSIFMRTSSRCRNTSQDRLAEIRDGWDPAGRQEAAHRPLRRYHIPDDTYLRRRDHGHRSQEQRLERYLQSWDVSNLFVMGATAFPQNAGYNPTDTVGCARLLVDGRDPL